MRLWLMLVPALLPATPIYSITGLGTLGGGSSAAAGLSSTGLVAGWAEEACCHVSAFFYSGSAQALATGLESRAYSINNSGTAAGIIYDAQGRVRATAWSGGSTSPLAGPDSYAVAINERGQIAGAVQGRATRFAGGRVTDLGIDAQWSTGNAINNSGAVAGTAEVAPGVFRAFIWHPVWGASLVAAPGGWSSYGHALNNAGWLAGTGSAGGALHAFLYRDGIYSNLGTLGGTHSGAYGINGRGDIVGYSLVDTGEASAFLYTNGIMIDLNLLIDPAAGWRLEEAMAINDRGQIVGTGIHNGRREGFLLNPVFAAPLAIPEPATSVMVAAGLGLVLLGVARRP